MCIRDSYNTDLPLLHPPHIIAVTAIFLSVVLRPAQAGLQAHAVVPSASLLQGALQQGLGAMSGGKGHHAKVMLVVDWLAESKIDVESIVDTIQELISLYEVWESYSERPCKEAITKFIKDSFHQY